MTFKSRAISSIRGIQPAQLAPEAEPQHSSQKQLPVSDQRIQVALRKSPISFADCEGCKVERDLARKIDVADSLSIIIPTGIVSGLALGLFALGKAGVNVFIPLLCFSASAPLIMSGLNLAGKKVEKLQELLRRHIVEKHEDRKYSFEYSI